MQNYIWCEDSRSGFAFWNEIFKSVNSEFIVESKGNNSGLRKAVEKIQNDENIYYILIDNVVDNPDVLREVKRIKADANGKNNIHIVDIHSFEFTLLSFSHIANWVFAEKDNLKEKRKSLLHARELFVKLIVNGGTANELAELKSFLNYSEKTTTEQISAKLLYDITRNTGFETNKSKLGVCFVNNCCEFEKRQTDDICGLDNKGLSADKKKKQLIELSVLKKALQKVGLYDNSI